jgi:hypothetical protein
MAVTKEDANLGSLTDILASAVNSAPATPSEPAAPSQPLDQMVEGIAKAAETVAKVEKSEPEASTAEVVERFIEHKTADGKVKKIKIGKDDSIDTWVKKALDYEEGMRKFQRERDEVSKKFDKSAEESLSKFNALQKAFKSQGIDGLINAMAGSEDAASAFRKEIAERALKRLDASPAEIAKMDYEEMIMAEKRAREAKELELEELKQLNQRTSQQANETLLKSRLDLAFDKVRLDGMFDDVESEEYHNSVIWEKTLSSLEKIAEGRGISEHEIPPQTIHAEFKRVKDLHLKGLNLKAEKVASQTIEQAKENALKTAQTIASKGTTGTVDIDALADEHMKNYNGAGFLAAMLSKITR